MRKHMYIPYIIDNFHRPENPSKGTIKRNIYDLMAVNKEERAILVGKLERPILRFLNNEKVRGVLNEICHLVITVIIDNCDVSMILIGGGIYCDIKYAKIFETLG